MTQLTLLAAEPPPEPSFVECERCKCITGHKLTEIHEGQSTRLDCGFCGRTLDFPTWYGKTEAAA